MFLLIKKTPLKIISVVIAITLIISYITKNHRSNKLQEAYLQCNSDISYCSYTNLAAKNTSNEESSQHNISTSLNTSDVKNNISCNLEPLSSFSEDFSEIDSIDINSTLSVQADIKDVSTLFISNNVNINSDNPIKNSKLLLDSNAEKKLHLPSENDNYNNDFLSSETTSNTESINISNDISPTTKLQSQQIVSNNNKSNLTTLTYKFNEQNVIEKPINNADKSCNSYVISDTSNPEYNPIYSYGVTLIKIKELDTKKNILEYNNSKLKAKIMDIYYISCHKVAIEDCKKKIFEMKRQLKTASGHEKEEIIFSLPQFKSLLKEEKKTLKFLNQEFSKKYKHSLNIHTSVNELCKTANNLVNEQRKNEKNIQKYATKITVLNQSLTDIHNILVPIDLNNSTDIPSFLDYYNSFDTSETTNFFNIYPNHSNYFYFLDNTHRQLIKIKTINEQIIQVEAKLLNPENNIKQVIQQCKQLNLIVTQYKKLNNQCINNINNFEKLVNKTQRILNTSEKSQRPALQASLAYFQEMVKELYHEKFLREDLIEKIEKKILQNEEIIQHNKKNTNQYNDVYHKLAKGLNKSIEQTCLSTDLYSNLYSYSCSNEYDD